MLVLPGGENAAVYAISLLDPQKGSGKLMNIILVDDEEIIHKTLGSFLARSGHAVRTALNGMDALRLLNDAIPDLIISDIRMPVMGGLELVEKFQVRAPATPIILITGHGDEDTAVAALHKGVHEYLRKPVKLEELLGLLERIEELKRLERSLMQERVRPNHSRHPITMDSLAAGIIHQIDRPTTMINDNLRNVQRILQRFEPLLRRSCGEDPEREQLLQLIEDFFGLTNVMKKDSEQIGQVVQQLQMFAHTQSRKVSETVDLSACLEQALAQTEGELRGILLEKQIRQEFVEGVGQELTQAFVNALQNAAQAIGDRSGGRIGVEMTSHEAGWITVIVADNGPGIADEIADRVFDPFFTTKDPGEGMGLGLTICQSIVSEHGGRVGFNSRSGQGCRLWVRLPHRQVNRRDGQPLNLAAQCN